MIRSFRRHLHKVVAEGETSQAGRERFGRSRRLSVDSAGNLFGQSLAIIRAQGEPALCRIGEKSAFDQDRRNCGLPQNVKTATANAAILGGRNGNDVAMNALGEPRAVPPIIVSLDSV